MIKITEQADPQGGAWIHVCQYSEDKPFVMGQLLIFRGSKEHWTLLKELQRALDDMKVPQNG